MRHGMNEIRPLINQILKQDHKCIWWNPLGFILSRIMSRKFLEVGTAGDTLTVQCVRCGFLVKISGKRMLMEQAKGRY